jgi:hypothetical protein
MAVTQQQVAELYVATFNRAPEAAGLSYWVNDSFGGNPTIEQIAASFFDQSETQALYPAGTTDEAFVTSIYQNLFNRAPDADGLAYWTGSEGLGGAMTRDVMIEAMKNGAQGDDAEIIANKAEVGLYYAEQGLTGTYSLASVTADDATVTTAKAEVDDLVPTPGETFTLTTSTDEIDGTANDDTIDGTVVNSLNAADSIIDETTTDNDTLNVKLTTADVQATVKNIENVNVDWASNNTIALDATNMTGNTFNLAASGLAFNGNATIKALGINDVNAGDDVTGTLTLQDIVTSTVDAGQATTVAIDEAATMPTVDTKSTVTLTVNQDEVTVTNTDVSILNVAATQAAAIDLSNIQTKLVAQGAKDLTVQAQFDGETVVNELTAGTLTLKQDTAGTLDSTDLDADLINIAAAVTTLTVADGQNFGLVTGGSLLQLMTVH